MRSGRSRIRARALQLLYAADLNGGAIPAAATGLVRVAGRVPRGLEEGETLAERVAAEREALDQDIAAAAEHWRLERLGAIDRNILRLAVWELRSGAVPPKVVINEAVQLAHWFGGPKSPAFVNGVLDRVAHTMGAL